MPSWVWIIIAVVVLAIIVAVVMAANKKKKERNRTRAGELREEAATKATEVQQREAHARETEAEAAASRAEADRRQAEADRLEAEARERQQVAASHREEHEESLRRADELDPDVDTKHRDRDEPEAGTAAGQDTTVRDDGTQERHEATTVTHPDGSTEAVEPTTEQGGGDPASRPSSDGGSHRA
jgi:FtsZ-interacting cell division protein ZipA